jgi:hypothetical protein
LLGLFLNAEDGDDMFPETQVDFLQTARNYIPGDSRLRGHSSEKLRSNTATARFIGRNSNMNKAIQERTDYQNVSERFGSQLTYAPH